MRRAAALALSTAFVACARSGAGPEAGAGTPPPVPEAAAPDAGLTSNPVAPPSRVMLDAEAGPLTDGPHWLPLTANRPILVAFPGRSAPPWRLVAHIHGMCGGPSYACATWVDAAVEVGAMVCPSGNRRCGDPKTGPETWEAPSWGELLRTIDRDLEASVARANAEHPGSVRREGAILTGYSRGAYVAPWIASMHPGRWPYLVLIEADASISPASLRAAGVRAVAFVAGERGVEIAGMKKREAALVRAGYKAKLFVMKKTGHLYSEDMADVMRSALAFVLEQEH